MLYMFYVGVENITPNKQRRWRSLIYTNMQKKWIKIWEREELRQIIRHDYCNQACTHFSCSQYNFVVLLIRRVYFLHFYVVLSLS